MKIAKRLLACLVVCTMLVATLASTFAFAEGEYAVKVVVEKNGLVEDFPVTYTVGEAEFSADTEITENATITVEDTDDYVVEVVLKAKGNEDEVVATVAEDLKSCEVTFAEGATISADVVIKLVFTAKKEIRYHETLNEGYNDACYHTQEVVYDANGNELLSFEEITEKGTNQNTAYTYPGGAVFKFWSLSKETKEEITEAEVKFDNNVDVIDVYPVFEDTKAPVGQITVDLAQRIDNYETGKRLNGELKKTDKFKTTYDDESNEKDSKTWDKVVETIEDVAVKFGFIKNAFAEGEVITDEDGYTVEVKAPTEIPSNIVTVEAEDANTNIFELVSGVGSVAIYVQPVKAEGANYLTVNDLQAGAIVWTSLTEVKTEDGEGTGKWVIPEEAFADEDEDGICDDTNVATLVSDGVYVVYAKLADKATNVAYISSEGILLDQTAPTIDYPELECKCETCGGQDCANCEDCEDNDVGEDIDFWFGTGYTNLVVRDSLSGIAKIEYRVWEKIGLDQVEYVSETTLLGEDAVLAECTDECEENCEKHYVKVTHGNTEFFTEGKFRIMWPTWGFYEILVWVTDNAGNTSCYRLEVGDFPPVIIPISTPIPIPIPIPIPDGKEDEPTTGPTGDPPPPTNDNGNVNFALIVAGASLVLAAGITVIAKKKRKVTE